MDAQRFPFYIILSNYLWSISFYRDKDSNVRQIRFHVCIKMRRCESRVKERRFSDNLTDKRISFLRSIFIGPYVQLSISLFNVLRFEKNPSCRPNYHPLLPIFLIYSNFRFFIFSDVRTNTYRCQRCLSVVSRSRIRRISRLRYQETWVKAVPGIVWTTVLPLVIRHRIPP